MTQLSIEFVAPHNGTATSIAAARRVHSTGASATQRTRILATLATNRWGLTCDEVERMTGLRHQTASARIRDLCKAGKILHHGTRPTRSGSPARVYFIAPSTQQ